MRRNETLCHAAAAVLGSVMLSSVAMAQTIPQIQGAGHISPLNGNLVTTTGIVTAVDSNGYFLQDSIGDGNDDTADAIFVFTSIAPTVSVGDACEVSGTVAEFIPGGASTGNLSITELISPTTTVLSSGNPLPAPVVIGAAGRQPPTEIIDNDGLSLFDPAEDGIDFYESLEGMRVTIADAKAVGPTNQFGEIFTVSDNGAFATNANPRGGITIAAGDFNPERVQVQFDSGLSPVTPVVVNTGALLGDVTGVVHYSFGNFEVKVTESFTVQPSALTAETTALVPTPTQVTIAALNVSNLDPNDNDGDSDIADGQFDGIAATIVSNLASPDIVALQEIQDNDGSADTGTVAADQTYAALAAAIVAAGGPSYSFFDIPPVNNQDGGQPGGNIRVGYLYNASRVSFNGGARFTDPDLSDGDAFANSRKPLYAEFTFGAQSLGLVNVHFTSKGGGGGTPLFGQVQPPVNGNEDKRTVQAMLVNQYVDGLIQAGGDIIVLGDVNEFEFNEPSTVLAGSILQNLTFQLAPPERYTFIFGGNSQALDHIYVSNSLASQVEYDIVHTEVEFANAATDHEPLLARVSLVGDSDSDGIADDADNCIEQANPDQYDANNDGIGNICDADFAGPGNDGDCLVNFLDLTAMKLAFFSNPASPGWDPAIDLDNSGLINFVDLNLLKNQFFGPPGPSALPNDCAL